MRPVRFAGGLLAPPVVAVVALVDELVQASRPGNTATAPTVAAAFKTLRRSDSSHCSIPLGLRP